MSCLDSHKKHPNYLVKVCIVGATCLVDCVSNTCGPITSCRCDVEQTEAAHTTEVLTLKRYAK